MPLGDGPDGSSPRGFGFPSNSMQASAELGGLGREDDRLKALADRFGAAARYLDNDCFCNGNCDPVEDATRRIRETSLYIGDAVRLAGSE